MATLVKKLYFLRLSNILTLTILVSLLLTLGNCSKEEWLKAISKIGITGFTEKNLLDLFDLYDLNKNEELDYKEFVGALYFNTSISRSKNVVEEKKQPVKPEFSEDTKNVMSGKSKKAYLQVEG